jgi:flagellar FliL protein
MPANPEDLDAGSPLTGQKKSGSPLVPLIAVIILVPGLVYAVMDFVILPKIKESAGAQGAAAVSEPSAPKRSSVQGLKEATVPFASLVVNLSGAGGSRYLRANIVVGSSDSKIGEILKEHEAPLRDAAITILSGQTPESVETPAGKDVVRRNLMAQFNRLLGADVIGQIYFTEFVVQ